LSGGCGGYALCMSDLEELLASFEAKREVSRADAPVIASLVGAESLFRATVAFNPASATSSQNSPVLADAIPVALLPTHGGIPLPISLGPSRKPSTQGVSEGAPAPSGFLEVDLLQGQALEESAGTTPFDASQAVCVGVQSVCPSICGTNGLVFPMQTPGGQDINAVVVGGGEHQVAENGHIAPYHSLACSACHSASKTEVVWAVRYI